jgi:hypothetical protein
VAAEATAAVAEVTSAASEARADAAAQVREEREDLVGSHGRWKCPCLQTAHMTI